MPAAGPADPAGTGGTGRGGASGAGRRELSPADQVRRQGLVRMKSGATALLLVAAVVYVIARRAEAAGAGGWAGFVRAAAEAGMVGGLADWFAVTALFRRPLGLPIPHTAIIPTRKDALGRNLSDFVGTNFLSEQVIRERLANADVPRRVGALAGRARRTPSGSRPSWPGRCAARSTCCGTRTSGPCWSRSCCAGWPRCRSARRWAGCWPRWSRTGPTTGWSTWSPTAVDDWLLANREQVST